MKPADPPLTVEHEEIVGETIEQRPVVGDEKDAPGKIAQVILQLTDRVQVKVIRRLVEEEEVRRRGEQTHEGEPAQLSAGEPVQRDAVHAPGGRGTSPGTALL